MTTKSNEFFKGIFVDYTQIIDFEINSDISKITWNRFGIIFSELYDTYGLLVLRKKIKRD